MAGKSATWQARGMDAIYGLPAEAIAERAGVDVSTARRWKTGATRIPRSAVMILEGNLGCFHNEWKGWHISCEGELVSPEGWRISVGMVLALPLMRQQIALYQAAARVPKLEDQPLPESAPAMTA